MITQMPVDTKDALCREAELTWTHVHEHKGDDATKVAYANTVAPWRIGIANASRGIR
jgi:hypothetical protein